MGQSWQYDGEQSTTVTTKLRAFGYTQSQIDTLLRHLTFHKEEEQTIQEQVFTFLRQSLVGGDPQHAFDLLNSWLYRASETRHRITYDDLVSKLNLEFYQLE